MREFSICTPDVLFPLSLSDHSMRDYTATDIREKFVDPDVYHVLTRASLHDPRRNAFTLCTSDFWLYKEESFRGIMLASDLGSIFKSAVSFRVLQS